MEDAVWALSPYKNITHKMLNRHATTEKDMRVYVVEKIKQPLMLSIIKYGKGKRPSTLSGNGRILDDIGQKFLEYDQQETFREAMFVAGLDILLGVYESPASFKSGMAIEFFGARLPEPTRENTDLPNTHLLLTLQEEFFKEYPELDTRAMRMTFRIAICEYQHDIHYYGVRMDWWLEQLAYHILVLGDWQDRDTWIDWLIKRLVHYVKEGYWKPREHHQPHYLWTNIEQGWSYKLKERIPPFVPEDKRVYA